MFSSSEEFLEREPCKGVYCLILDIQLPGLNGIELQKWLAQKGISIPIIFITGNGDIPMSVKAMKNGAEDFLPKPFDEKDLISAIRLAIERNKQIRKQCLEKRKILNRIDSLTPRELEVFRWLITGMLNKQIAYELSITEKTIKVHRGRIMKKMQVESVAQLVRLAEKASIKPAR